MVYYGSLASFSPHQVFSCHGQAKTSEREKALQDELKQVLKLEKSVGYDLISHWIDEKIDLGKPIVSIAICLGGFLKIFPVKVYLMAEPQLFVVKLMAVY